jgi:hypothetical protein
MEMSTHEFATRPALIRRALDLHVSWIEKTVGVPISQAVIVQCDVSLIGAAMPRASRNTPWRYSRKALHQFAELLQSAEIPPSCAPMLQADAMAGIVNLEEVLDGGDPGRSYSVEWDDCPVAFQVRGVSSPVIAMAVSYHAGPDSVCENTARILVFRREAAEQVLRLLEQLSKSDGEPKVHTHNDLTQRIPRCGWDQLVPDPSVISLLKDDFESFFRREPWFRKMRLPFRRGYMLHGPPATAKAQQFAPCSRARD